MGKPTSKFGLVVNEHKTKFMTASKNNIFTPDQSVSFGSFTFEIVGQVAQAARRLAAGWVARDRSQVLEGWRFFFTPSCPDWPWGPLNLLQNEYRGISPGVKAAERMTSHPNSS